MIYFYFKLIPFSRLKKAILLYTAQQIPEREVIYLKQVILFDNWIDINYFLSSLLKSIKMVMVHSLLKNLLMVIDLFM